MYNIFFPNMAIYAKKIFVPAIYMYFNQLAYGNTNQIAKPAEKFGL